VLSPFVARNDRERRLLLNAIGPFWDGNEVWLLTGGGALFAAFPHAYATVFSGFYLALMLVLFALIVRAVSFEFRSKVESKGWRRAWDWAFFVGSLLPALLTGVAVGNVMRGVPLDAQMEFTGNFFTLLNPFSLLVGLTGLAMFVTHGAIYLVVKTNGAVAERAKRRAVTGWTALVVLMVLTTVVAAVDVPTRFDNYLRVPIAWVVPILAAIFLAVTRISLRRGEAGRAFLFSALSIAGLMGIFGVASYPYLLPARNVVEYGLTIYNASASQNTLTVMFIIALIGMPLVIAYTAYIYYIFRGKARVEEGGY
jgi:cytochrome d ubiquinol oxidase subunit II